MNQVAASRYAVDPSDTQAGLSGARRYAPAVAAGLLWLAAGLSAGYGVLQAVGRTSVMPVAASPVAVPSADPAAVARALGARAAASPVEAAPAAAAVAEAPRYTLQGVIASVGQQGAALIAVNGQSARPFRVGSVVDVGLVLQSVSRQKVRLGATVGGPTTLELALPVTPGKAP